MLTRNDYTQTERTMQYIIGRHCGWQLTMKCKFIKKLSPKVDFKMQKRVVGKW